MVLQDVPESIPPYSYDLQTTCFKKEHLKDSIAVFGKAMFGDKVFERETPHRDVIGKNPDICRKLFGIGSVMVNYGLIGKINQYDNHAWIPQINRSDPNKGKLEVCFNCGSLKIDGKFYAYNTLK